jgi:uncharacterized protein (DUF2132 family)
MVSDSNQIKGFIICFVNNKQITSQVKFSERTPLAFEVMISGFRRQCFLIQEFAKI